ncbi:hypothetical protein [Streptomyces avermitilis]|uniref:hypothetical protein n=1 Tax=Streptomyces avermitilis TaxID=33903 RepID=UPI0036B8AFF6
MDDSEVGRFVAPLTEYLERAELERALSDAGCVEVRSESVEVEFAVPSAETFLDELDPVLRILPQCRAAVSKDGDRFRELLAEEVRLVTEPGAPPARGNIAYARVRSRRVVGGRVTRVVPDRPPHRRPTEFPQRRPLTSRATGDGSTPPRHATAALNEGAPTPC